MPDIAVLGCVLYALDNALYGVELVRSERHEKLVALMQDDVLRDHLAEGALLKEFLCENAQLADGLILIVSPEERLLEVPAVHGVVGVILRIHPVADHKELQKPKEPVAG